MSRHSLFPAGLAAAMVAFTSPAFAQTRGGQSQAEIIARRNQTYAALDSIANIEHKVRVPMRDGVRLATDIYRPRNTSAPVPTIFVRTPYNMNWWDVPLGAPRDVTAMLDAVGRGYAYVEQNERGRFYSEGEWDILGPPRTDGYDAISWIAKQPWSNGKVGTLGCSSTAEWQIGVAALRPQALAAMNPQGFGAGIGRVEPFYEQGNWYRGGVFQMLFARWMYDNQNNQRPTFSPTLTSKDLERLSRAFDLVPRAPAPHWPTALQHLPIQDIIRNVDGPRGAYADSMPVATGGRMIQRTPDDPAWYRGGLYHDDMVINVPALWFMSWYDVSVAPNLEVFNHVQRTATPDMAAKQYAVIAPVLHCQFRRSTDSMVVGERQMGDVRLDYSGLTYAWFDHFLKGEQNGLLDTLPRVRYYTMGLNKWQAAESWPPSDAKPMTLFLSSRGNANSARGDGALVAAPPARDAPDRFTYDPKNPVPTLGGGICCIGGVVRGGSFDHAELEQRPDVLVYTSAPLDRGLEVTGPIEVTLYVSSDRRDTDFTVKILDVYPDGTAYNLEDTILRARYREGYGKQLWLVPGQVHKLVLGPMVTSNYFAAGHRIRIEVSSSNFPRYERNLNTGGRNYDEVEGLVARNAVHHSRLFPSQVTLTIR